MLDQISFLSEHKIENTEMVNLIEKQKKNLSKPLLLDQTKIIDILNNIKKSLKYNLNDDLMNIIFTNRRFIDINSVYEKYKESINNIKNELSNDDSLKTEKRKFNDVFTIKDATTFTADNFEYYGDKIIELILIEEASEIFDTKNVTVKEKLLDFKLEYKSNYTSFKNTYKANYEKNSIFSCIFGKTNVKKDIDNLMELGCLLLPLGASFYKALILENMYADYFEAFVFGIFLQTFQSSTESAYINAKISVKNWLNNLDVYNNDKKRTKKWFSRYKNEKKKFNRNY